MEMTDAHYRWVIVAAGGLLGCVAVGAMFSLPVLLTPMTETTGWSRTGISTAMTIGFLAMAGGSMAWGTVSDRFGPRFVVLTGSCLLTIAMVLSAHSTTLLEFQLVFGLCTGIAASAILVPMMATVTGWFDTQRSLAVSLVSAGMGMAPMTMSPLVAWLNETHDWRGTMMIVAGIVAVTMIPVSFLVKRPPALERAATTGATPAGITLGEAIRSPQFIILTTTNFFCCATHSGPIFHTVSYAITCGIAPIAAVSIYSLEGLAGMGGRIFFGVAGDKFGAKRVLVIGLLVQALGALAYYFAHSLGEFYLVAALFGFTYAGVMPLYSVLARENFPLSMMGSIIGGTAMAGGLGMAVSPLLGGWIYDSTGSYGWLYLGSFGMGLGAMAIALTFRPFPEEKRKAIHA
jgi:MFS family permease